MSPYIAARVLHRDADLLVIDKPAGLPVHPDRRGGPTLADWLDELRFGEAQRPELAHRLDRDTSGCLVLGRHAAALRRLAELFGTGAVEKRYWAIAAGSPQGDMGEIDLPLGRAGSDPRDWRMRVDPAGQPALTRWRVLGRTGGDRPLAWLELEPVTGRTHQLRVHCAARGWPILGDGIYGHARGRAAMMLHARRIVVPYRSGAEPVTVEAPPPPAMRTRLTGFAARIPSPLAGEGGSAKR